MSLGSTRELQLEIIHRNEITCVYAAIGGCLATLQYARNNGHNDILKWTIDNGCPDDSKKNKERMKEGKREKGEESEEREGREEKKNGRKKEKREEER
jgi:hypothetical protein